MKRLLLGTLTALLLSGCGAGGSSDGSSGGYKGTGYLKVELPDLPVTSASVSSMSSSTGSSVGSLATIIDGGTYAAAPSTLTSVIENLNTADACIGGTNNIPFVICVVESLGINSVGTYQGPTPKGEDATVVVSSLSGDPDGYDLQAIVSLDATSEDVFKYKADSTGRIGIIEIKPDKLFPSYSSGLNAIRVKWNTTATAAQTLEYTYHYSSGGVLSIIEQSNYMYALYDGNTDVVDIASRFYQYVDSTTGFIESQSHIAQHRVGHNRVIALMRVCDDSSTPTEGTECFAPSTMTTNELVSGQPMVCGTIPYSGNILLTVTDSKALSVATAGSMAYAGSFSTDLTCEALRADTNGGNAFSIRVDKDGSMGANLNGIFYEMRSKAYLDMKLLASGSFLP